MPTVGIKTLKNKLSEYVRLAVGEIVQVTDRNRVVAELVPPRRPPPLSDDEFEAQGVREGWLTPARDPHAPLPPRRPVLKLADLLRDLDRDREDW